MRIKSVYTYQALVFLTGFIICFIGVTLDDFNRGYNLAKALGEWDHYIAPVIMGIGMSIIGQIFWVRKEHRLKAQKMMVENENKYKILYENMIDAVCMLDSEKRILDVNTASQNLFECTKEELTGLSIDQFIYKEDKAISNKFFEKLDNTGSYAMYEGRIVTKTGKIKWIQVNSTEFYEGGEKIGSQDIIRDITIRKNIEIELEETVRKLNALNSTKDKLFSIIAHDLRSPFNSILGLSDLLLHNMEASGDKKEVSSLKIINSTAQNTLYLLENLLNWAKSQTGQIVYNPVQLSLKDIFREIKELAEPTLMLKNISMQNGLSDDIKVFGDENMLRSVIGNLVNNAVKFTGAGGIIELSARKDKEMVEISVSDDGIGIDKEIREKLFTIESDTSRPGTSNEKGSGLGLVLCREFIANHGGRIWVESDGKRGSTFKFTVPLS